MLTTRHLLARAMFGLSAAPDRNTVPNAESTAKRIDHLLCPGQIALLTGPSGAGKSTILKHLKHQLRARNHAVIIADPSRLATRAPSPRVIDALNAPLPTTLSLLASCGLADATILDRRIHELSTGQRWRLSLALAMHRTRRLGSQQHATLIVDEFASMLDDISAHSLCRTLCRWITSRPIRAICATHNHSLRESLTPEVLATQPLHGSALIQTGAATDDPRQPQMKEQTP